jgi:hypothetical protein
MRATSLRIILSSLKAKPGLETALIFLGSSEQLKKCTSHKQTMNIMTNIFALHDTVYFV